MNLIGRSGSANVVYVDLTSRQSSVTSTWKFLKNLGGKTFKTVPKISTIIFKEVKILKCPYKYYSDLTVYLRESVLI